MQGIHINQKNVDGLISAFGEQATDFASDTKGGMSVRKLPASPFPVPPVAVPAIVEGQRVGAAGVRRAVRRRDGGGGETTSGGVVGVEQEVLTQQGRGELPGLAPVASLHSAMVAQFDSYIT
eukprot:gene4951-biopygen1926